jgi:hypothetical protein
VPVMDFMCVAFFLPPHPTTSRVPRVCYILLPPCACV